MAKVTMPLMSGGASGKFAGAMVFSETKGRSIVRQLVSPANPMSAGQVAERNKVRVAGAIQRKIGQTITKGDGRLKTDKQAIQFIAAPGQSWNADLVKAAVGTGGTNYAAAGAAWGALTAPQKTAWDTAAAAAVPVCLGAAQKGAGNVAATPITGGEVWFRTQYALYVLGIRATAPAATPPTYS